MKRAFYEIDCRRVLDLMAFIENRTGKCFHEVYPDLDVATREVLDGERHGSFVINTLARIADELEGESK